MDDPYVWFCPRAPHEGCCDLKALETRGRREEAQALKHLRDVRGMKLSDAQNAKADAAPAGGR